MIDLHLHSTFSDGLLSPTELAERAAQKGVTLLALCDHDTTDGLAPMKAALRDGMTLLPSIELSTAAEGRTHVLGYGVDPDNDELCETLRTLRRKRIERGRAMLDRLRGEGVELPEALLPTDGRMFGRAHLARALIAAGAVANTDQAFARYLGEGKPAYVPLEHIPTSRAIALLKRAHAVPVLAHPMRLHLPVTSVCMLLQSLMPYSLQGVEVYHPSISRRDLRALDPSARRMGLLVTGGSDFHGDGGGHAEVGALPSGWTRCTEDVEALQTAMRQAAAHAKD